MWILLVHAEVRPELLAEFREAIQDNAARSIAHDAGCLRFDVSEVDGSPTKFVFYEVYRDEASWQAHRMSPHFLAYKKVADRALVSRGLTRLQPLFVAPSS
jgi:(4S)-4-hydroxy-5-phosphonooxypentane-2,3-dione isomerase